jgi:predicted outer membrane protein
MHGELSLRTPIYATRSIHVNTSKAQSRLAIGITIAAGLIGSAHAVGQERQPRDPQSSERPPARESSQPARPGQAGAAAAARGGVDKAEVDRIIAGWLPRPRLGASMLMAKYGMPQAATPMKLTWNDAGQFKRIEVMNLETPHDFPLPHVDFMEHTISYQVPADKIGDLLVFDGSSTIQRTTGELSARCDLEAHNVLTLNLNHDIITGKKSVEEARQAFGEHVQKEMMGNPTPYVQALQFKPMMQKAAMFTDEPVIANSPLRAPEAKGATTPEAEALASVAMIDKNEVVAAMQAKSKQLSQPVMEFANTLHRDHGMNFSQTLKVGQQADARPVITPQVSQISKDGAAMLAPLVTKEGAEFERGYLEAMVKGHTEALAMIDGKLMQAADDKAVKAHLEKTREVVAGHLEKARALMAQR